MGGQDVEGAGLLIKKGDGGPLHLEGFGENVEHVAHSLVQVEGLADDVGDVVQNFEFEAAGRVHWSPPDTARAFFNIKYKIVNLQAQTVAFFRKRNLDGNFVCSLDCHVAQASGGFGVSCGEAVFATGWYVGRCVCHARQEAVAPRRGAPGPEETEIRS